MSDVNNRSEEYIKGYNVALRCVTLNWRELRYYHVDFQQGYRDAVDMMELRIESDANCICYD